MLVGNGPVPFARGSSHCSALLYTDVDSIHRLTSKSSERKVCALGEWSGKRSEPIRTNLILEGSALPPPSSRSLSQRNTRFQHVSESFTAKGSALTLKISQGDAIPKGNRVMSNPFTDADPAASTPIMGARAPQEPSKGLYVPGFAMHAWFAPWFKSSTLTWVWVFVCVWLCRPQHHRHQA
jgi:hypothetical protein